MNLKIDLSKKPGTIGYVITTNYDEFMSIKNSAELAERVRTKLNESNINTPASRRLMASLTGSKSIVNSQFILSNTLLKSQGLGV